jgi:hypothetical protein
MYWIILLIFIIIYIIKSNIKEDFYSRIECPTRNMSYDLRGEAHFPPRTNFPFDNSEIGPSNQHCYPKRKII